MATIPQVTQFRDIIKLLSPPWLATGVAEKYMYAIGLGVDLLCEKLNEAMRAHMPGEGTYTALPYIGADRNLWAFDRGTSKMLKYDLQGHLLYTWGTWGDFPGVEQVAL